jgi:hypothetical protein
LDPFDGSVEWTHVENLGIGFEDASILQLSKTFLLVGGGRRNDKGEFDYHKKVLRYDKSKHFYNFLNVQNALNCVIRNHNLPSFLQV